MNQNPTDDTRYVASDGTVTPLFRESFRRVLFDYVETARFWAPRRNKSLNEFAIREASIVGSCLRGIDNSDLDLLIIADKIDQEDYRFFKQVLSTIYYSHRSKDSAIDVYVRPYDEYPERESLSVTCQVRNIIDEANSGLGFTKKVCDRNE